MKKKAKTVKKNQHDVKPKQHSKQLSKDQFKVESIDREIKSIKFIGLSLSGGKSDKACLAVLEYFPKSKKVFLSRIYEKIKSDEQISADAKIHELILQNSENLEYVAIDTPWNLPQCLQCQLKCPGVESCKQEHIEWMWHHQEDKLKKKRPKKMFTPYTQRAIEMFISTELEHKFQMHHAMGANSAPILARAQFIHRRIKTKFIEVFPALTFYRIGHYLNLMKSQIIDHRAAFGGDDTRAQFLQKLNDANLAFIYHQDAKNMIENNHAFEAFLCGYTAFLKYKGLTEKKPKDFPAKEDWIEFPVKKIG